ncbi:hypothetical protein [Nocardia arizonensis]|uniref:hypothetical protein n=1 Tax=Nocardia arizonensis TaxID=1141647 RepID=UPI0006D1772A|nr:hypothetical protein [Nocardia arizonensis]
MLKPYKELSRWYGALEPDSTSAPSAEDTTSASPPQPGDEGQARHPAHIGEDDPERSRGPVEVPTDLPARRSEFVGGWSDWVAADHAPGPDDDYEPRPSGPVRFPWPEDDDIDDGPLERSHTGAHPALRTAARRHPAARRARFLMVLLVIVLLFVVAGLGVLWLLRAGGRETAAPRPMQFTAGSVRADAAADCPTERSVGVVRGAEAGGTESGPDAVLAFQYAYYVARSGEQAREVVAPDAPISAAAVIQRGIDSIPPGTTHCVRVVTITDNRYSVEVTEYRPGGAPATYNRQTVTTAVIGGRTLITGIAAG